MPNDGSLGGAPKGSDGGSYTCSSPFTPEPLPQAKSKSGLKLLDLIDKFFLRKSHSKPATVVSYKNTAKDASHFLGNRSFKTSKYPTSQGFKNICQRRMRQRQ